VRYQLLSTALGGSFTSRLNQNLREKNGFTYGAGSRYGMGVYEGSFIASASVKAAQTGAALKEFLREFDRLRAGPTGDLSDDEATKVRETLRTDTIQTFSGLRGILAAAAELSLNGLPLETIGKDLATIESVKASDLNAMSKAAIPIEQGVLILVGDKKLILEQVKELGLPEPMEFDAQGKPVK
jgi:predicted Zn-dependent peptidase